MMQINRKLDQNHTFWLKLLPENWKLKSSGIIAYTSVPQRSIKTVEIHGKMNELEPNARTKHKNRVKLRDRSREKLH
jgi:hypothetical protein